jgi:hypothetical protein
LARHEASFSLRKRNHLASGYGISAWIGFKNWNCGQRIQYSYQYLAQRHGTDPQGEKVPQYFKEKYNKEYNDALDLDV